MELEIDITKSGYKGNNQKRQKDEVIIRYFKESLIFNLTQINLKNQQIYLKIF